MAPSESETATCTVWFTNRLSLLFCSVQMSAANDMRRIGWVGVAQPSGESSESIGDAGVSRSPRCMPQQNLHARLRAMAMGGLERALWRQQIVSVRAHGLRKQLEAAGPNVSHRLHQIWSSPHDEASLRERLVAAEAELRHLHEMLAGSTEASSRTPLVRPQREAFERRVDISFLLLYFRHPDSIAHTVRGLYGCTHGSKSLSTGRLANRTSELIVIADSWDEASEWARWQNKTASGAFMTTILSNNLHEVHGYNRAAAVARGDLLVLLQDDDVPPPACNWVADLWALFWLRPQLGAVGMRTGSFWYGSASPSKSASRHSGRNIGGIDRRIAAHILYQHPQGRSPYELPPFEFVTVADFAPFALRRSAFEAVGGLDEGYVPAGTCGITTDIELCLRLWKSGWQVGHMRSRDQFGKSRKLGGTHAPAAHAACWKRQLELGHTLISLRYDQRDFQAAFEEVKRLNAELLPLFDGPPKWDACCLRSCELCPAQAQLYGKSKRRNHEALCSPCDVDRTRGRVRAGPVRSV